MSRLINRQRQLAEQGRLRLGYTVPATKKDGTPTTRPVRSETWILTSHSHEHIEHAAHLWGGDVEEWQPMGNGAKQWRVITHAQAIHAILPPGDPLTQAYEMWSKGGCQRRCDGVTESFSGSPCLCLAQFGEQWYDQTSRYVCSSKSRLKVLLPDMPGLGAWRMETGSFYATDEIAGMVDTLRGAVGDQVLIPVSLRIEQRTRVAGGETKQFVVPVLELRGVTAGALLSGEARQAGALMLNDPTKTPRELEAAADLFAPWFDRVAAAETVADLQQVWREMVAEHLVGSASSPSQRGVEFVEAYKARASAVADAPPAAEEKAAAQEPNPDGSYDADVVPDADGDAVWSRIVEEAGKRGMTLPAIQEDFSASMGGLTANDATSGELQVYLEKLLAVEPVAS